MVVIVRNDLSSKHVAGQRPDGHSKAALWPWIETEKWPAFSLLLPGTWIKQDVAEVRQTKSLKELPCLWQFGESDTGSSQSRLRDGAERQSRAGERFQGTAPSSSPGSTPSVGAGGTWASALGGAGRPGSRAAIVCSARWAAGTMKRGLDARSRY